MTKRIKFTKLIFLFLIFFLLLGCSQTKEVSSAEGEVREVIDQYTQAAIKDDYNAMYELLSPEDKSSISMEEYAQRQQYQLQRSGIVLKSGEIKKIKVSKGKAVVDMELQTAVPNSIPTRKALVNLSGKWYITLSDENKKELSIGKSFEEFQQEHPLPEQK